VFAEQRWIKLELLPGYSEGERRYGEKLGEEDEDSAAAVQMHQAEDSGLWEGNSKILTGRRLFLNGCSLCLRLARGSYLIGASSSSSSSSSAHTVGN